MKILKSILGSTRRADISFFRSGKIEISSRVARALNIAKGDVIDILAADGEFLLFVAIPSASVVGRHEARCFPSQPGSRHFRAHSRRLCKAILNAAGLILTGRFSAGDPVEINGRKAIPIITRKPL